MALAGSILHLKSIYFGVANYIILVSNGCAAFIRQSTLLCLCMVIAVCGLLLHVSHMVTDRLWLDFGDNLDILQLICS